MTPFKTVLVASAILAAGMLPAAAQTASPGAGVSAATHCKDAQGNIKLKTASSMPGTPAVSGDAKGGGSATSGGTTGSGSMSGSASGSTSGSSAAAANLSPCK